MIAWFGIYWFTVLISPTFSSGNMEQSMSNIAEFGMW
jgi:hypothetical protein